VCAVVVVVDIGGRIKTAIKWPKAKPHQRPQPLTLAAAAT